MAYLPDFSKLNGLLPAITQDWKTKEVLMVAFMNREAWQKTIETGEAVYFSRTRNKLWHKGESSGNVQKIREILIDCDEDTIVLLVDQIGGAACHTGFNSCFYRKVDLEKAKMDNSTSSLVHIKEEKIFDPKDVYGK